MDTRDLKYIVSVEENILKVFNTDRKVWGFTKYLVEWKYLKAIPKSEAPNYSIYNKYVIKDGKFIIDNSIRLASTYSDSLFYEYKEGDNHITKYSKTTVMNNYYFAVSTGVIKEVIDHRS